MAKSDCRLYTAAHADRLAFIRHCRNLDMALDEIRSLLRLRDAPSQDCGEVNALLDEHIGHVGQRKAGSGQPRVQRCIRFRHGARRCVNQLVANNEVLVIPMIETKQAVDNLESILDVPGIDGIYVGPSDLAFSLDLRRDTLHRNIVARTKIIADMRRRMNEVGFNEFTTPILTASSPEGARDFLVPSRIHPGKFFALPQAPQCRRMAGADHRA